MTHWLSGVWVDCAHGDQPFKTLTRRTSGLSNSIEHGSVRPSPSQFYLVVVAVRRNIDNGEDEEARQTHKPLDHGIAIAFWSITMTILLYWCIRIFVPAPPVNCVHSVTTFVFYFVHWSCCCAVVLPALWAFCLCLVFFAHAELFSYSAQLFLHCMCTLLAAPSLLILLVSG